MVHDRHAIAELVGLLHVVRGQQDRLAVAVQFAHQVPERKTALGVKAGGGLVQEQHGGPVEDRAGDHQSLGHASRKRVNRCVGPVGQLEALEKFVRAPVGFTGREAEQPAVEVEVLDDRQLAVEGVGLRDRADQLLGPRGFATTSTPPTCACPDVGTTRVVSIPAVVVLPAPLGPSRPKIRRSRRSGRAGRRRPRVPGIDLGQGDGLDHRRPRRVRRRRSRLPGGDAHVRTLEVSRGPSGGLEHEGAEERAVRSRYFAQPG